MEKRNDNSGLAAPLVGSFLVPAQCEHCKYRTRAPFEDKGVYFDDGWQRDTCEMYPGGSDGWKPNEIMNNEDDCVFRVV